VDGNTIGPGRAGNGAGNRLADPPGRICGELVATAVFELVHRLHQADIAFLNEVEELQAAIGVLLGDGYHQAQIGFHHFLLGLTCFAFALLHLVHDAAEFSWLKTGGRGQFVDFGANFLDLFVFGLVEFFPALGGKIGDAADPVGIEFGAEIFFQEIFAGNTIAFGQPQQTAFQANQALVDAIELLDQCLDAIVVERE